MEGGPIAINSLLSGLSENFIKALLPLLRGHNLQIFKSPIFRASRAPSAGIFLHRCIIKALLLGRRLYLPLFCCFRLKTVHRPRLCRQVRFGSGLARRSAQTEAERGSGNAAANTGEETRGRERRLRAEKAVRRPFGERFAGGTEKTGNEAVGLIPGFGFRRQSACRRRWAMRFCPACTLPAKRGVRRQSRARPHRPRTRVRRAARARSIQSSPPAR